MAKQDVLAFQVRDGSGQSALYPFDPLAELELQNNPSMPETQPSIVLNLSAILARSKDRSNEEDGETEKNPKQRAAKPTGANRESLSNNSDPPPVCLSRSQLDLGRRPG